jgi:hypothetical protein
MVNNETKVGSDRADTGSPGREEIGGLGAKDLDLAILHLLAVPHLCCDDVETVSHPVTHQKLVRMFDPSKYSRANAPRQPLTECHYSHDWICN